MTALGLVVAVPAVLAYNWLIRRNKSIMEDLAAFTNDLHGYMMSDGAVKPRFGGGTGPASRARADQDRRRSDPAGQRAAAHRPHADGRPGDADDRRVIGRQGRPGLPGRALVDD